MHLLEIEVTAHGCVGMAHILHLFLKNVREIMFNYSFKNPPLLHLVINV
jgi:hypothetical protein